MGNMVTENGQIKVIVGIKPLHDSKLTSVMHF